MVWDGGEIGPRLVGNPQRSIRHFLQRQKLHRLSVGKSYSTIVSATSSTETAQWRKIKCNQCDNVPNGLSATSYNGRNCMVGKSHTSVTNAMQCDNTKGLFHHFSQKKLLLSSYHGFNAYDLEIAKSWNNSCNCSLFTRVANLFIMIRLFLEPKLLKNRAIMRAMP